MTHLAPDPGTTSATLDTREKEMTIKNALLAILAVALVATAGLVVRATGNDASPDTAAAQLAAHLHQLGQRIHGNGQAHELPRAAHIERMAGLLSGLELDEAQRARLERVHDILTRSDDADSAAMVELHETLMVQFEAGRLDTEPVRRAIDDQLERARARAYGATDELIPLINGLDESQRAALRTKVRQLHGDEG